MSEIKRTYTGPHVELPAGMAIEAEHIVTDLDDTKLFEHELDIRTPSGLSRTRISVGAGGIGPARLLNIEMAKRRYWSEG